MTDYRPLFELPAGGPYLLSHSVGCLPRATRDRLARDLFAPWAELGSDGWPAWLAATDRFRAAVGGLVGAAPNEICPQPSVSAALTNLLSGLKREEGRDTLLASEHTFPSIGFAMRQFERFGYRLDLIPADENPALLENWTRRIDRRTAAVVAMHVHSNNGLIAPIAAIAEAARNAGALSVADLCQSTGIIAMDLHASGVDAAVGSCVKWLCGGSGAGFLYLREDRMADFDPLAVGWFSHENPFEFDINDFRFAPDARRFWGGTPGVAPYILATAGIETIMGIGVDEAYRHNRAILSALADAAERAIDMTGRGGTLCLTTDAPEAMAAALAAAGCRFDQRGRTIRLSPHVYSTLEDARITGTALRGLSYTQA